MQKYWIMSQLYALPHLGKKKDFRLMGLNQIVT